MTTDRLLGLLNDLRSRTDFSRDAEMRHWQEGWNDALGSIGRQVRLEDALSDGTRAERLADAGDHFFGMEADSASR